MSVYYTIFVVTLLIQFIPNEAINYRYKLILTFLPLFLYGCFRVDFGYGYNVYEALYDEIARTTNYYSVDTRIEPGYMILNRILPSFRSLIVLTSLLPCIAYYLLFLHYIPSKYSWFAIILLFLSGDKTIFFMFSGIRNSISISLLMMSFYLIKERKILLYFMVMLLASTFHTSALIFYPVAYFVGTGKSFTERTIKIWFAIFLTLTLFPLDGLISKLLPFVVSNFDRYSGYMNTANSIGDTRSLLVISSAMFMAIVNIYNLKNEDLERDKIVIGQLSLLFIISYLLGL